MLSSNEEIFKNAIGPYREALLKSGYDVKEGSVNDLKYTPRNENGKGKADQPYISTLLFLYLWKQI